MLFSGNFNVILIFYAFIRYFKEFFDTLIFGIFIMCSYSTQSFYATTTFYLNEFNNFSQHCCFPISAILDDDVLSMVYPSYTHNSFADNRVYPCDMWRAVSYSSNHDAYGCHAEVCLQVESTVGLKMGQSHRQ